MTERNDRLREHYANDASAELRAAVDADEVQVERRDMVSDYLTRGKRVATAEDHTFEDFAYVTKTGWWVAITIEPIHSKYGWSIPGSVWCNRHGWENLP